MTYRFRQLTRSYDPFTTIFQDIYKNFFFFSRVFRKMTLCDTLKIFTRKRKKRNWNRDDSRYGYFFFPFHD